VACSYYRDKALLYSILDRQQQMVKAMELCECLTEKELYYSEPCLDLCSMYIIQIVELYKKLTGYSQYQLRFLNAKVVSLRNDLVHNYAYVNTKELVKTIVTLKSKRSMESVNKAIGRCDEFKKQERLYIVEITAF